MDFISFSAYSYKPENVQTKPLLIASCHSVWNFVLCEWHSLRAGSYFQTKAKERFVHVFGIFKQALGDRRSARATERQLHRNVWCSSKFNSKDFLNFAFDVQRANELHALQDIIHFEIHYKRPGRFLFTFLLCMCYFILKTLQIETNSAPKETPPKKN